MGRGAVPLPTSAQVFVHFLAPGNPGTEWGRMLVLHIENAGQKHFVQGEVNARGQGHEGSLWVKQHHMRFIGTEPGV